MAQENTILKNAAADYDFRSLGMAGEALQQFAGERMEIVGRFWPGRRHSRDCRFGAA